MNAAKALRLHGRGLRMAAHPLAASPTALSALAAPRLASSQYAREVVDAARAVRLASKLCQTVQRELSNSEKVDKADDSPVTVADYAAQALVAWVLSRSDAACQGGRLSMVAEEDSVSLRLPEGQPMLQRITDLVNNVLQAADAGATVLSSADVIDLIDLGGSDGGAVGRHWVLDPIDGTRGFVGMRQYSVCLGMLQDGEVQLGLLGCPNLPTGAVADDDGGPSAMQRAVDDPSWGALFLGVRGAGAYVAPLLGQPDLRDVEPIQVQDLDDVSTAQFMESFESRHSDHSFHAALAREMGVAAPPLRMDSQVKYGLLSRGVAPIFMRFPPPSYKEKIWDHCAGFVIVEEAGGRVTDAGGRRLDFTRGRYLALDRGIIAAPPRVHAEILRAIEALKPSPRQEQ